MKKRLWLNKSWLSLDWIGLIRLLSWRTLWPLTKDFKYNIFWTSNLSSFTLWRSCWKYFQFYLKSSQQTLINFCFLQSLQWSGGIPSLLYSKSTLFQCQHIEQKALVKFKQKRMEGYIQKINLVTLLENEININEL